MSGSRPSHDDLVRHHAVSVPGVIHRDWQAGLYRLNGNGRAGLIHVGGCLCVCVSDGIASGFQSLGFDHPQWTPRILAAGKLFAVLIAGGFIVIALWAHFVGARP